MFFFSSNLLSHLFDFIFKLIIGNPIKFKIFILSYSRKNKLSVLPVDFLSTQWVEKSACLLPTYVPLVSGIFGLVWTTMFLMCSTGSRVLIGYQNFSHNSNFLMTS